MKKILMVVLAACILTVGICGPALAAPAGNDIEAKADWRQDAGKWYYYHANGKMATGWQQVGGTWYYLNADGAMATGWKQLGNTWYYLSGSGAMLTGWQGIDSKWYYFYSTGAMATGWQLLNKKWYYLKPSGAMATGWQQVGSTWYYLSGSGAMLTGWQGINSKWYYLKPSGAMAAGWLKDGNTWYYLKSSGAMATGWQQVGSKWYYLKSSGAMIANQWLQLGSKWYWFDSSGAMATGTRTIDGKKYTFNGSGMWMSSSFAQLAPTTYMPFTELVGDNGNYDALKGFPAKGTYKVVVDLYHQVVMVYSKDSSGNYTVPVRYMITTTGGAMTPTPTGYFSAKDTRKRFAQFSTGEYGQYWTKVVGEIYFHSILYTQKNANSYYESVYKLLGTRGSHGCIRLLVPDARWIYYHIAPGTTIEIRAGSKNDTATANIKSQLTRAALPSSRPNCNNVPNTDVWSIGELNAQLGK